MENYINSSIQRQTVSKPRAGRSLVKYRHKKSFSVNNTSHQVDKMMKSADYTGESTPSAIDVDPKNLTFYNAGETLG